MLRQGAKWLIVGMLAFAAAANEPKIVYPDLAAAEPYARELMDKLTPAQLDAALLQKPADIPLVLRTLGSATFTKDMALQMRLARYLNDLAALRARRAESKPSLAALRDATSFLVVDPVRFTRDAAFRAKIAPLLSRALDTTFSAGLREACLRELNTTYGLDFDTAESIAAAWGSIPRRSSERRVKLADARMPDDLSSIETSIYSINSAFFPEPEEARALLSAVRASAPKRRILVLADAPMAEALRGVDVTIVQTFSRPYTPWPRDPFTVARTADGGVLLINRPNLQPRREEDGNMARALVQFEDARWTVAPIPFHNGHILLTPKAAWISIHSVEIRALQILKLKRVPVQSFAKKEGIEKYLGAVRKAAKELEELYQKPVRFVHPLTADLALIQRLAGGGGYDLDSLLTLLPQSDGSLVALVGDFSIGAKFAPKQSVFGSVAAAPKGLQTFLDTSATHLAANGIKVKRLPLLNMKSKDAPEDFLLTWNNVVLQPGRAEGFASLIPEGDALARKMFADAGYKLELFPPLVKSVTHSGGYRCASNHVRVLTAAAQ